MGAKGQKNKVNSDDKLKFGTLMIWQGRMISTAVVTLIFSYLMVYCTDTLKIPGRYVAVILILSKVLDGVTDTFAGFIVDKTKTKFGKARPYEVFIIGLWLTTWLLFSTPEKFSIVAKCIWVFAMYALSCSICSTFLTANSTSYMVRAFKEKQIVKLTSYGSVITMLAAAIFNIAFPTLVGTIAVSATGWSRLIGLFAIPLAGIGILRMIFIPEKYDVDASSGEEVRVKDISRVMKTNKYILILALMNFVFNFVTNMGVETYYYKYIVQNIGLMGVTSVVTIIVIPLAFAFPKLIAKYSVVKLMIVGFLISAFGYLLNFFAGTSIVILLVAKILTGMGTVPASMLLALVIIECADFNEWKGIPRMEGTMTSITGLASKIGAALGTGALGVIIDFAGFTGDLATTSETSLTAIRLLFSIVPMILYILVAVSLKGYKLTKLMPQIKENIQAKRESAETASEMS
ncbi:MFS transporter [Faecalicatena orotica]|uniref:MFS transporter n=1 Tax=Faecalicatena orotica TaxID=1544 RepID=UPI0032169681